MVEQESAKAMMPRRSPQSYLGKLSQVQTTVYHVLKLSPPDQASVTEFHKGALNES